MPSRLVLIGSGETGPVMVTPHQQFLADVPARRGAAVFLDTPYGFQQNADELTSKITSHFNDSVGRAVGAVSLRSAEASATELATALAQLGQAEWVFAGPGSPTYALGVWDALGIGPALAAALQRGTVVLASAAAVTAGAFAVPVYEIYKVGQRPQWWEGIDLLGSATGLRAAVIPHFNNAEGGSHDTRYCYLGESRLQLLEQSLPADAFVLGIDEHTGLVFDLDLQTARVFGRGQVTLRKGAAVQRLDSGSELALGELKSMVGSLLAAAQPTAATATTTSVPRTAASPVAAEVAAAVAAVASPVVDRAATVGPFIDVLLQLRNAARTAGRWAEADQVRDLLAAEGVVVEDGRDGSSWRLADQ